MGRVELALDRALEVLAQRPAGLLTDIDGTISAIVSRPEQAVVSPRARRSLKRLVTGVDVLAVITARDAATAKRMVAVDGIEYIGNYGLFRGSTVPGGALVAARERVRASIAAELPCVSFEEKGVSFALHYRNCDDREQARQRLMQILVAAMDEAGGRVQEGKMVIEVVPAGLPDKSAAVAHLAAREGLQGIVYLGDDLSDVAAFELIRERRAAGLAGVAIGVADDETAPQVRATTDLTLSGVGEVEELLERLADELGRAGAP